MIGVQIVGVRGKVISVALVSAWLTSLRNIDFIRVAGSEAGEQPQGLDCGRLPPVHHIILIHRPQQVLTCQRSVAPLALAGTCIPPELVSSSWSRLL
jgi:hypothetical protein